MGVNLLAVKNVLIYNRREWKRCFYPFEKDRGYVLINSTISIFMSNICWSVGRSLFKKCHKLPQGKHLKMECEYIFRRSASFAGCTLHSKNLLWFPRIYFIRTYMYICILRQVSLGCLRYPLCAFHPRRVYGCSLYPGKMEIMNIHLSRSNIW